MRTSDGTHRTPPEARVTPSEEPQKVRRTAAWARAVSAVRPSSVISAAPSAVSERVAPSSIIS